MSINWGKGIVIGLAVFIIFIVGMGIKMFSQNTDDYDHEYYEKGLAFDADYAKEKQVVADHAQPQIKIQGSNLQVTFIQPVNGKLHIERPADRRLDRWVSLQSGTGAEVTIPVGKVASGRYRLVFDWVSNGKKYLYQQEVHLP